MHQYIKAHETHDMSVQTDDEFDALSNDSFFSASASRLSLGTAPAVADPQAAQSND
jgi:hypothetical protein